MKRILIFLVTLIFMVSFSGFANANVIDFDDIALSGEWYLQVPANYEGFNWDSDWYVAQEEHYKIAYGNSYDFPSGDYAAMNNFNALSVEMSGNVFDFTGAYFSSFATAETYGPYGSESITVMGYLGATLMYTAQMVLPTDGFEWLQADMSGVDRLVFTASARELYWLMDDFTYTAAAEQIDLIVPEPTSLLLLGFGLLGIAVVRRASRK